VPRLKRELDERTRCPESEPFPELDESERRPW